ncbi:MAG: response regulator [Caldithrix sp.]|nr:response regulator [Caldithrix sp.]
MIEHNIHILLIEDEDYDVQRVRKTLEPFRQRLIIKDVVADGQAALDLLQKRPGAYDVIIMDYQIVGGVSGEQLIRRIKAIDDTLQIIVITKMTVNITDYDFANRLMTAGAMWYCTKYPGDIEDYIYQPTDFILSILNAYEKRTLEREKRRSLKKLDRTIEEILQSKVIVGRSAAIETLRSQIERIAGHDTTVLITGESGTGKELVATHLHYRSDRKSEKFVPINSGSLPQELIESELFGYEKGAFTGAGREKAGLFEIADHGTVFLDEIAELPSSAQVKLLRVLQEGEIDKIGRTSKINVNVRIIAATNKDLRERVRQKKFREDLFYRLNVVTLHVPGLRERKEDIPLLIDHFLKTFSAKYAVEAPEITEQAVRVLQNFEWKGNVRQLQNVIQRLLMLGEEVIDEEDIRNALGIRDGYQAAGHLNSRVFWDEAHIVSWRDMEKNLKRDYFKFVRDKTQSDAEAARRLGLAPPNYYRMCKELGLK